MKSLPARIISAVCAILILIATYILAKNLGLICVGAAICIGGCFEYKKMLINPLGLPKLANWFFFVFSTIALIAVIFETANTLALWGVFATVLIVVSLWLCRARVPNEILIKFFGVSIMGMTYCALFPGLALKLLLFENGIVWFGYLLSIVFAGDIFAFFGGILFGKTKVMPNISPNKTVAGSIAGILGSVLAGLIIQHYGLKAVSVQSIIFISVCCSILAQNGDFFESLIKRVSGFKDSGTIMPGHGGVLDRLDGVYFAAPFVYLAATTYAA